VRHRALRPDNAASPLLSPRFAEMFEAAQYRQLRKDKMRMYFQYLMAPAKRVDYDYFLITAGWQSLSDRFAHLASVEHFYALRPFGAPRVR